MPGERVRLCDLGCGVRLGLTFLALTMLGGLVAAGFFIREHHQNRDEQPGLTLTDIKGVYHGVKSTAPLISALERHHPDGLPDASRQVLLKWLGGSRLSEDYDNPDLGDLAPAEVISRECGSCHARNASKGDGIGQRVPLERWEDVKKVAFSRDIQPNGVAVLLASTHTHALSMASMGMVGVVLAAFSRWPRALVGLLSCAVGVGLLADIGGWWLTRQYEQGALLVAGGGLLYNVGLALLLLMVVLDLWWPRSRA